MLAWLMLAAALLAGACRPQRSAPDEAAAPPPATPPSDVERTLDLLTGASPASLGSAFAGVELGRVVAQLPSVSPRAGLATISLLTTGRRVDGADIKIPWDPGWAGCYQFMEKLHHRWGQADEVTAGHETWHDVAHARAATFIQDFTDCNLRFFRLLAPEQWLNETRSSLVPVWAIGHPVAELEAELGLPPGDDPAVLAWRDESLGDRAVELTAHVQHGQVVGITVAPPFTDPVAEILWERLKAVYGPPELTKAYEESIEVRWRRAPGIEVGKYWGHDAIPMGPHGPGEKRGVTGTAPMPRPPTVDDGVLTIITFGT